MFDHFHRVISDLCDFFGAFLIKITLILFLSFEVQRSTHFINNESENIRRILA